MQRNISRTLGPRPGGRPIISSKLTGLTIATLLGLASTEAAVAQSRSLQAAISSAIQSAGQAGPTPAWIAFCQQTPHECTTDASEPEVITLSQDSWDLITRVNEQVNRTILPVTDQEHWGVLDRWDYPDDGMGDCEDIQLLKRKRLIEAGLPRRVLRMTVVVDEQSEGHAVLMVRTDRGDFILDNKRNTVLAWQETGYRFVNQEGAHGREWVWLGDQTAPVVTANR
ncbi:transglutaminase-like cysteine peptidase [Microvirga roseola]|uniref:transglutaminase-like cysteine peptidase n=1 Tax=Microvirga roseola TaxID=2883126 RepID=UPI001E42C1C1|nr:transglutaminase-like cysteine peptidase [Microvirga roseola]